MRSSEVKRSILTHLRTAGHLTLFLDYDGTLVPIAPTPPQAVPDEALLALLARLALDRSIRTVILSGRPLEELQRMLPVQGLIFAGLYGVEMQMGGNTVVRQPPVDAAGDTLARLRAGWARLAGGLPGFLLEDKGQALALHARWADAEQAAHVLAAARALATDLVDVRSFRLLDGDRYIEVAPQSADKGETVGWVLDHYPIQRDLPVAFGDDNKDDAAFDAVHGRGGLAVGVGHRYPLPGADARLESPEEARGWLASFLEPSQAQDDR
jgi:trehalose 6-phosphate phosphatase